MGPVCELKITFTTGSSFLFTMCQHRPTLYNRSLLHLLPLVRWPTLHPNQEMLIKRKTRRNLNEFETISIPRIVGGYFIYDYRVEHSNSYFSYVWYLNLIICSIYISQVWKRAWWKWNIEGGRGIEHVHVYSMRSPSLCFKPPLACT